MQRSATVNRQSDGLVSQTMASRGGILRRARKRSPQVCGRSEDLGGRGLIREMCGLRYAGTFQAPQLNAAFYLEIRDTSAKIRAEKENAHSQWNEHFLLCFGPWPGARGYVDGRIGFNGIATVENLFVIGV